MGKADQDSRDPLDLLKHLPQNQNSSVLLFYAIHQTLLTLTGGYPRPPFSEENKLGALANKSPEHEKSVSTQASLLAV